MGSQHCQSADKSRGEGKSCPLGIVGFSGLAGGDSGEDGVGQVQHLPLPLPAHRGVSRGGKASSRAALGREVCLQVYIDTVNIRMLDLEELREQLIIIPQVH